MKIPLSAQCAKLTFGRQCRHRGSWIFFMHYFLLVLSSYGKKSCNSPRYILQRSPDSHPHQGPQGIRWCWVQLPWYKHHILTFHELYHCYKEKRRVMWRWRFIINTSYTLYLMCFKRCSNRNGLGVALQYRSAIIWFIFVIIIFIVNAAPRNFYRYC